MVRTSPETKSESTAEVLVIGDGVIGLAIAIAIARSGGSCRLIGRTVPGAASAASAGLLAPSIGNADEEFRAFMRASRDRYPAWLHWLSERTGVEVTLDRSGIVEIGGDLSRGIDSDDERLDAAAIRSLEPSL